MMKRVTMSQTGERVQTVIRPGTERIRTQFHLLWNYRELLYFLVWRDLKVRYKQTVLGVAWAVLQPFATMVVFSIFLATWRKFRPTVYRTRSSATARSCRGYFLPLP